MHINYNVRKEIPAQGTINGSRALELFGPPPGPQIYRIQCDAKYVGGNKAQLRSPEANEANDHAIDCRQHPSFPAPSSDQNRRTNRQ